MSVNDKTATFQEETKSDTPSKFQTLLAAAECDGGAEAEYQLGLLYETGEGVVEADPAKAVEWYRKAVEGKKNHVGAYYRMGVAYEEGKGVERKDLRRAVLGYHNATKKVAHKEAQERLQKLIQKMEKEAKNANTNKKGDVESLRVLGFCHDHGFGVEKNVEKALDLYQKANEVQRHNGGWSSLLKGSSKKEEADKESFAVKDGSSKKKKISSAEWLYEIGDQRVDKYHSRADIDEKMKRLQTLIDQARKTNDPKQLAKAIVAEKEIPLLHDLCEMERFKSVAELNQEIDKLQKKQAKQKTTLEERLVLSKEIESLRKQVREQEQSQICFCM